MHDMIIIYYINNDQIMLLGDCNIQFYQVWVFKDDHEK